MASSAAPSPAGRFNVSRAPAHVEFDGGDTGLQSFPPPNAPWSPTFSMCFDAATATSFAKLRIDFSPKAPRRTIPLFIFIAPENIGSLTASDAESPDAARTRTELCTNLTRLDVTLKQPPTIVGPPPSMPLVPKNKSFGEILEKLHCITQVTKFAVYLPSRYLPAHRAELFCQLVGDGSLRSAGHESTITHLYNGNGGNAYDAGTFNLLALESASAESPPSYDELALSSPPPPPSASERSAPPSHRVGAKRKRVGSLPISAGEAKSGDALREMCRQMLDGMKAELRDEVRQEARMDMLQEMARLKEEVVAKVEQRLEERSEQLRQEMRKEFDHVWDQMESNHEDVLTEAHELIDVRIDDQITGFKDELQEYVKDELRDTEERVKDSLRTAYVILDFD